MTSTNPSARQSAVAEAFAPLRHRTFRLIWVATLLASFGSIIQAVGAAWLMTSLSESVQMVALVQSSTVMPILLFGAVSGALADAYDRRTIMLVCQSIMLVASAALAALTYADQVTPALLLCLTFLIGAGVALNLPASQSAIRDQVSLDDLPAAVSLNSIGLIWHGVLHPRSAQRLSRSPVLRKRFSNDAVFTAASLVFAVSSVGAGLSGSLAIVLVGMVAAGAAWVVSLSTANVVIQLSAGTDFVGRTMALYQMCAFGSMAVGAYCWGILADLGGLPSALFAAGALLVISALLRLAVPLQGQGAAGLGANPVIVEEVA